jgi:stage II sporulation protein Q
MISSYQCLGDISVKENDTVTTGEIIATSGTCNISKNLGNHLHLEISKEGKMINPESIYDKEITELD